MRQASLRYNQETQVSLTLCNPCDHLMHVILLPTDREEDDYANAKVHVWRYQLVI